MKQWLSDTNKLNLVDFSNPASAGFFVSENLISILDLIPIPYLTSPLTPLHCGEGNKQPLSRFAAIRGVYLSNLTLTTLQCGDGNSGKKKKQLVLKFWITLKLLAS